MGGIGFGTGSEEHAALTGRTPTHSDCSPVASSHRNTLPSEPASPDPAEGTPACPASSVPPCWSPVVVVAALVAGTLVLIPDAKPLGPSGDRDQLVQQGHSRHRCGVGRHRGPPDDAADRRPPGRRRLDTGTVTRRAQGPGRRRPRRDRHRRSWLPARAPPAAEQRVVVDATPPVLTVDPLKGPVRIKSPVVLHAVAEPDATVTAEGGQVQPDGTGFTVRFPAPPLGGAKITAVDAAGNATQQVVPLRDALPRQHPRRAHDRARRGPTPACACRSSR